MMIHFPNTSELGNAARELPGPILEMFLPKGQRTPNASGSEVFMRAVSVVGRKCVEVALTGSLAKLFSHG